MWWRRMKQITGGVGDWTHWQQEQQRRGRFAGVVVPCACGPSPPARLSSPFSSSSSSLPRRGRESDIAGAREGAIACGDPIQQNAVGGAEEEDEYAWCCCVSTCKWYKWALNLIFNLVEFKVLNCVWFICFGSNWELVIPEVYMYFSVLLELCSTCFWLSSKIWF